MANPLLILKTAGFWIAKTAGKEFLGKAVKKATPTMVDALRDKILGTCQHFVDTPNPYDDVIAYFLCELFDLEVPSKSEDK